MCDSRKTKKTLLEELKTLRSRAAELERIEAEHKKVEQKLKQYQFMVESAHDAIFFKDLKSRYVIANDKTLEAFRLSREQVIGKDDYEIMPRKAEAGKNIEDDKLVFKTSKPTKITKHMTGSDGKERWFQAIKVPQFDNNGNIIGLVGIARDITALKHAEETLRESEEKYKTLCHNIPGMVYIGELDWSTKVICNSEYICGYSTEEFNFQKANWLDIINPDDKEKAIKEALGLEKKRTDIVQEYRIIDKSGSIRWVEDHKTPLFTKEGIYKGVDGIAFDITERKKAEEALRESEEKFRTFMETASDLMHITDKDGNLTYVNDAMAGTLGYSKDEMIGMHLTEVLSKEEAKKDFGRKLQELVTTGEIDIESVWLTKDGKEIYGQNKVVAVYDRDGNFAGGRGILRDITERKRAEEELQQARDELEIRVEQRTADLARVNEQLRSLASELSLAEERMRRRIAMDVHDHVGQNLAISKIKIESLRESAASPELAEDLEEIRDLISQTIESTRSLTFELSPPVLYELGFEAAVEWLVRQTRQQYGLSADFKADGQTKPLDNNVRVLLFQAVRELLVNVAKHAQAHNVTVSTRGVGNEIRVSVEDDGVGFGVSKAGSHDYKTGGFGLFSIRERLGHIGGHLEIQSKPGRGTRVTLTAPIDQESQNDREQRK